MDHNKLSLSVGNHVYPIFFEKDVVLRGILLDCISILKKNTFVIITHIPLVSRFAYPLMEQLRQQGKEAFCFSFPSGERYKTRKTKNYLEDQMIQARCMKDTLIIAIGGGVVTDMAGYVASSYLRGVDVIFVPTTLLGMVDAAIGGKNGVNTSLGKNTLGTFYHPIATFIDSNYLQKLPKKYRQDGFAEMIKIALVSDENIVKIFENNRVEASSLFEKMIFTCCKLKKDYVEKDPTDCSLRRLLNFGHTFGHALERVCNYRITHGLAISWGMVAESYLSMLLGLLSEGSFHRIVDLFNRYNLLSSLPFFDPKELIEALLYDKKSIKKQPRFVLLQDIGRPLINSQGYVHPVEEKILERVIPILGAKERCSLRQ